MNVQQAYFIERFVMFRVFFEMFFASMRLASNVNHVRIGTDAAYRAAVLAELDRAGAIAARPARATHGAAQPGSLPHAV